jgi:catechol 2,3-dioxygenase-like lactoylglutathione lyase family enzyme
MIDGIFHVGITVKDLEKSIAFYRDALGMELTIGPSEEMSGESFSELIGVPNSRIRLAVLRAGGNDVELMQFLSPLPDTDEPLPRNGIGAAHVALKVADIGSAVARLKSLGVEFLGDVTTETEGVTAGWQWVFFRDPDGILVELSSTP